MKDHHEKEMIAPCGLNCSVCRAYLRQSNHCSGCRAADEDRLDTRWVCKIRNCETFSTDNTFFCFKCDQYPCIAVNHLDKRYRASYGVSVIENLATIREHGVSRFMLQEEERWACASCGGTLCMHKKVCPGCGEKIS